MSKPFFVVPLVLLTTVTAACLHEVDADADAWRNAADNTDEGGVIVGDVNWVDADTLPASSVERQASRAVAYVFAPNANARCSGFLISPDVLMTNQHCIPSAQFAAGVRANFTYERELLADGAYVCDQFIGADVDLDYALVRCTGRPGDRFGWLDLVDDVVTENALIQLFHQQCDFYTYPLCEPTKKMSPGKITGSVGLLRLSHDADMLGGSSGGPIVAKGTKRVVALNNSHLVNSTNGRGTTNLAVPMSKLLPHVRAHFPQALGGAAPSSSASCASVPAAGRTLDEDDDCTTLGGDSRWLRAIEDAGVEGDLVWTGTTASANPSNYAEYALRMDVAGRYEVAVSTSAAYGTATTARYRVRHAGTTHVVTVSQAARDGFIVIGTFDFASGGNQFVRVDDNTGTSGQHVVFDAVRVTPVVAAPSPSPSPSPPPTSSSCTQVRVTAATLNVRPQPNTQQAAVGTLSQGDVVDVLERVTGQSINGNTQWFHIDADVNLAGYISGAHAVCVD